MKIKATFNRHKTLAKSMQKVRENEDFRIYG